MLGTEFEWPPLFGRWQKFYLVRYGRMIAAIASSAARPEITSAAIALLFALWDARADIQAASAASRATAFCSFANPP